MAAAAEEVVAAAAAELRPRLAAVEVVAAELLPRVEPRVQVQRPREPEQVSAQAVVEEVAVDAGVANRSPAPTR